MKHKGQKPKSKALVEDLNMNKFYLIDNQRESEGWGSLVCYSSWSCKEQDKTEWLNSNKNRILCSKMAEYTIIPRNMKHSQKLVTSWTTLFKSQRIEILLSDHGATKLIVNNRKMPRNFPLYLGIKKYPSQKPIYDSKAEIIM